MDTADLLPISPEDQATYRAIASGQPPRHGADVGRLLALGLISADPSSRDTPYIAHDPRLTARRLMTEAQTRASDSIAQMAQIPALEQLAASFDPFRWYGGPASELLGSRKEMNGRIGDVLADATGSDMLTAQPAAPRDRDPEVQRLGIERVATALDLGAAVRMMYPTAVYAHQQSCAYLDDVTAAGAEVATLDEPFPRLVIVGTKHLFIDNLVQPAATSAGWYVMDQAAIAWAREVYNLAWARGTRWRAVRSSPSVLTARQRAILRTLEEGLPQQKVGPAIGLADRTVTKDLADAKRAVGARSLYQLMAWWGREGGE